LQELAEYLELSIDDVVEALEAAAAHHSTSLDVPRDDGDGDTATLADSIGEVDAGFELTEVSLTINAAIRQLPARERHVLLLRFFEDRTQTEIAKEIGVSQMQVSRILRRALARLNGLT
jgi:RNA polymerase sigma-B factor